MKALITLIALMTLELGAAPMSAQADDTAPEHIAGTWSTSASLHEDATGQVEMYLLADGFGVMSGSTATPRRIDGADEGKHAPRAIIAFPITYEWGADKLTLRSLFPNKKTGPQTYTVLSCHYEATDAKLICMGPGKTPFAMKQRSLSVPDDVAASLDILKSNKQ